MMSGGAFALATLPLAALGYLAVLDAGTLLAINGLGGPLQRPMQALLLMYGLVLAWCVLNAARGFHARLVSEREAARQGQLVALLLRDFEEHAASLLWEVGADGCLTHVAPRLAQALDLAVPSLQTLTLPQALALRAPAEADVAGRHAAALRSALAQGRAFRDLELPLRVDGELRWWSLTAKPLADEGGRHAGWRGVIADVTMARAAHHQLAVLAHFDPLTGLANRVQLRERLAELLERNAAGARSGGATAEASDPQRTLDLVEPGAATPATPLPRSALVCLDVDHFKAINDTLGHAAGDAVLVVVAERLRAALRWGDLAARLGGDEFALLIDEVGSDDELHALARRLTGLLNQPCEVHGQQVALGMSLGLAVVPSHGATLDELMAHADLALYAAKEAGRGCYEVFVPRLGDRHRRRLAIEQGLRGALVNGQLRLKWQPRIAIDGWRVIGAEALLRWQHPQRGLVSPGEFIPIAESSDLILQLDRWMLGEVAGLLAQSAGCRPAPTLSVNASARWFASPGFVDDLRACLASHPESARRLVIELTEGVLVRDPEAVAERMSALGALGVRFSIDDFGTGYSSLAYLKRLPLHELKIDRSFILDAPHDADDAALVGLIVSVAGHLRLEVVAEGVETAEHAEWLRTYPGVRQQGYRYGRPQPAGDWLGDYASRCEPCVQNPAGKPGAGQ